MVRPPPSRKGKGIAGGSVTPSPYLSNKDIKDNLTKLANRPIVATRFFDENTLRELGLLDQTARVMDKLGLKGLFDLGAYTYKTWTRDFIASLVLVKPNESEEGQIYFRLNNANHTLTFTNLREAFGITKPPSQGFESVKSEECHSVWLAITQLPKFHKDSLSTQIPHPVLRLITRFLSMAFLGQGESRKINSVGVTFLKAMTLIESGTPDWVDVFVGACLNKRKSTTGAISLGGMITLIGRYLDLEPPVDQERVTTEYKFDGKALVRFGMLTIIDNASEGHLRGYWNMAPGTTKYLVLPRGENSTPLPEGDAPHNWYTPSDFHYHGPLRIMAGGDHVPLRIMAGGERMEEEPRTHVDAAGASSSTPQQQEPNVDHNPPWLSRIESILLAHSEHLRAMEAKMDQHMAMYNERWELLEKYAKQNVLSNMQIQRDICAKSNRKLIVLDLNGLLVDVVDMPCAKEPDLVVKNKGVYKRPHVDVFLDLCFRHFDVALWTSRLRENVDSMLDGLFQIYDNRWRFIWDQYHCTQTGKNVPGNPFKPLMLKEFSKIWDNKRDEYGWKKGFYDPSNTLLLDDSPYKALKNPPNTVIFPWPYKHTNSEDNELTQNGGLLTYLRGVYEADHVQGFVEHNPYGQEAITAVS